MEYYAARKKAAAIRILMWNHPQIKTEVTKVM